MRALTICILSTFFSLNCICQTEKPKKDIEFGISVNGFYANEYHYTPQLTFSYGGMTLKAGPAFGPNVAAYDYPSNNKAFKFNGGLMNFQFNPNKKAKYFDFYFIINLSVIDYVYIDGSFNSSYYQRKELIQINPTLGYGFKFKLFDHFYITNDFALGNSFQKFIYKNGTVIKSDYFTGNILVGVGYYFKYKSNPKQE